MSFEIPLLSTGKTVQDLPDITVQADLDGATFTLRCRWNNRGESWFLRLLEEDGTTVVCGSVRMVVDFPLMAYRAVPRPAGALVLVDTSGRGEEAGFEDLGARCALLYFTQEELGLVAEVPALQDVLSVTGGGS